MRFSQRIGKKEVKVKFQTESIDGDLKIRLWNIIDICIELFDQDDANWFYKKLWKDFFNKPIASIPAYNGGGIYNRGCKDFVYKWFFKCEWYEIYDLLEYLIGTDDFRFRQSFIDDCNQVLEIEVSSYRIIDKHIVRIDSEMEISAIEEAIGETDHLQSVNTHLKAALDFLSNRSNPDYRNSIKESISALEAYCKKITGDDKATLGKALAVLEKDRSLHPSLKSSFSALYGYTSDASGIRHALTDDAKDVSFDEAKYMLVSCSAFINYLKSLMQEVE